MILYFELLNHSLPRLFMTSCEREKLFLSEVSLKTLGAAQIVACEIMLSIVSASHAEFAENAED